MCDYLLTSLSGGPGSLVLGYGMVCSKSSVLFFWITLIPTSACVWAALQTLSEMTIAFPVSGNFIDYADRFVDPALAFGAGFAEWLGWTAVVASEATFFGVIINYWVDGKVHQAVWCGYTLFDLMFPSTNDLKYRFSSCSAAASSYYQLNGGATSNMVLQFLRFSRSSSSLLSDSP